MIIKKDKNEDRKVRHERVRDKVEGTAQRPRLNVYRSLNHIYAQIIDDVLRVTLCSASTMDKDIKEKCAGKSKVEEAKIVGGEVAKRAAEKGISQVVFDRSGYIYTGRVAALAQGARDGGLKF